MTNGEKFKEVFGFGADGSRVIAVNATWWDCEFQNRKPITKADCIRAMSDEELAGWLADHPVVSEYDENNPQHKAWLDWLKQEAE